MSNRSVSVQPVYGNCKIAPFFVSFFLSLDLSATFMQSLQQMGADSQLQSLPPAVQKAIFLHLAQQQQQQQESHPQGNDPQRAEGQDGSSNRGKSQGLESP